MMPHNFDLIPTFLTQATALRCSNSPVSNWRHITQAYPLAASFSSHGRFFMRDDAIYIGNNAREISIRYVLGKPVGAVEEPQIRVCPNNYPNGLQVMDHTWPIATKNPANNPSIIWQDLKAKWQQYWNDPAQDFPGSESMFSVEVKGDCYLYMARLNIIV